MELNNKMKRRIPSLNSQLKIVHWIFGISMVFCPLIGMILLDRGYEVLGFAAWFFPVAQLLLILAVAVEDLIDMERTRQGKKSITPLNWLFFPQKRYIERLFESGRVEEAFDYAEEWLEVGKYSKDQ